MVETRHYFFDNFSSSLSPTSEILPNTPNIKPAEYLIELFLDMAWNIKTIGQGKDGLNQYMYNWLDREFGKEKAGELVPVMNEYYRLAYIRKPEFMGGTRTEESDPSYKIIKDLPWSESFIRQRLCDYERIEQKVEALSDSINSDRKYSWFQLVEYPVVCAAEMNKKLLYAQLARHGKVDWDLSDAAYEKIVSMTQKYNSENNGKWNRIMSFNPRNLPVYGKVPHQRTTSDMVVGGDKFFTQNRDEFASYKGDKPVLTGFGYENGAVSLAKGASVVYDFETDNADSIIIEVSVAPNHPVVGSQIRYSVSVNGENEKILNYTTKGRSEEWKQNVLRNQAIRKSKFFISKSGKQELEIKAVDEGVVIDQINIYKK